MHRIKQSEIKKYRLELVKAQDNRCTLCGGLFVPAGVKEPVLDHDHVTGAIRAALCRNCNAMEGKVFNCARRSKGTGTPSEWLRRVCSYWKEHAINPRQVLHPSHKTKEEKIAANRKQAKTRRELKK